MRAKQITLALLAATASLFWSYPSVAEEPVKDTPNRTFALSAMVTAKPLLSRNELDPSAVGMNSSTAPATASQRPQGQNPGIPKQLATIKVPGPSVGLPGRPAEDETPGAYLKEYNVNWSQWISTVADRWFYVLHNAEYQFGVQFVTQRPALIQFTCYADGTIGNIMLKQSSGVPVYDRLQVACLLEASPTPPFPTGTHRNSITLVQGWESHPRQQGEQDFQLGSFGKDFPMERVRKWCAGL